MDTKKILIALSVGLVILAFVAASWADETRIPLEAAKEHPGANGTAYLTGDTISIHAKGLRPGSVYTVWFVNLKPQKHETGAGSHICLGLTLKEMAHMQLLLRSLLLGSGQ